MRATRPVAGSAAEPPRIARPTTAGAVGNEVVQPIEVRVPAGGVAGRVLDTEQTVIDDEQWRFLLHARGRARAPNCATLCGRPYFPRAVFFFGFGFLVFPVLSAGASFFGRFGDTGSLLLGLTVLPCPRVRSETPARPAEPPGERYRSASPACQSTEPSPPTPETAIVNGCCKRARPAKVARRCVPLSLSRATAASQPSQQTTCQESGSASADHSTRS